MLFETSLISRLNPKIAMGMGGGSLDLKLQILSRSFGEAFDDHYHQLQDLRASIPSPSLTDSPAFSADDHIVQVTLTALNGDLSIAERSLTLNSKNNSIPVGRASKSVTKGILGAADNAWFDSPVMSRNHATIEFNSEDMVRPLFLYLQVLG